MNRKKTLIINENSKVIHFGKLKEKYLKKGLSNDE